MPPRREVHIIRPQSFEVSKQCNDSNWEEKFEDYGAWTLTAAADARQSSFAALTDKENAGSVRSCSSANSTAHA